MSLERFADGVVGRVVIAGETSPRVELSPAAATLLERLWEAHGPLMFHQSGGCCDGSAPMCYPAGEFLTSGADVLLGELDLGRGAAGPDASWTGSEAATRVVPFWMSAEQFAYWRHTHLTVDVVPGRGSGFSVEAPEGVRFLIRSRLLE
ncbi:DUF779 domain-containing protein [Agromyces lapidis]|uniref:DUF779 domain-containing protein n=1 Tax=Agromyces lapidis TaxID=279574 RepID=A0ABV5SQM1_9MICO|nr:DUF779 domain-containing protein [Agromyces lapidis]